MGLELYLFILAISSNVILFGRKFLDLSVLSSREPYFELLRWELALFLHEGGLAEFFIALEALERTDCS